MKSVLQPKKFLHVFCVLFNILAGLVGAWVNALVTAACRDGIPNRVAQPDFGG
jgi:uncharacterized membrane protein YeaQ/YmgE (transglycosylase-associated protein family)